MMIELGTPGQQFEVVADTGTEIYEALAICFVFFLRLNFENNTYLNK